MDRDSRAWSRAVWRVSGPSPPPPPTLPSSPALSERGASLLAGERFLTAAAPLPAAHWQESTGFPSHVYVCQYQTSQQHANIFRWKTQLGHERKGWCQRFLANDNTYVALLQGKMMSPPSVAKIIVIPPVLSWTQNGWYVQNCVKNAQPYGFLGILPQGEATPPRFSKITRVFSGRTSHKISVTYFWLS